MSLFGRNGVHSVQPSRIYSGVPLRFSFPHGWERHFFVSEKVGKDGEGRHKGQPDNTENADIN